MEDSSKDSLSSMSESEDAVHAESIVQEKFGGALRKQEQKTEHRKSKHGDRRRALRDELKGSMNKLIDNFPSVSQPKRNSWE
jgi:hypothetical protein